MVQVNSTVTVEASDSVSQLTSISKYAEAFKQVTAGPSARKLSKGPPIFEVTDIFKVSHPLMKLLRYIFVIHGVTLDELMDKTNTFAYEILRYSPAETGTFRGNTKKQVMTDTISFQKFVQIVCNILELSLVDLQVGLVDKTTGNRYTHSLRDIESLELYKK